ncbi:MAG: leucine-rich repeat domain-containing protein, partial [Oscillospiraceae bacterium]|nr:leucine-rich repeat domain-containing protein [Oscillospiraceae bacterium]
MLVVVFGLPGRGYAKEYVPELLPQQECGDYVYEKNADDTVTIVAYNGEETQVEVPDALDGYPVSAIADQAFAYYEMDSLDLPAGITVTSRAFEYCVIRESLTLPAGIKINSRAFEYADLPPVLRIPEGAALSGNCFSYCEQLRSLFLEPGATVKGNTFSYSEDLQTLVCASGSGLADSAFYDCEQLTNVILCGDVARQGTPFRDSDRVEIATAAAGDYPEAVNAAVEKAQEPAVTGGSVKGRTYENETLGLGCSLPKGWTVADAKTLAERMGIDAEDFEQTGSLADYLRENSCWIDLWAETKEGESLCVMVSPVPETMTDALEFFTLQELAELQGGPAAGLLAANGCRDIGFAADEDYDFFPLDDYGCLLLTATEDGEPVFVRELFYRV